MLRFCFCLFVRLFWDTIKEAYHWKGFSCRVNPKHRLYTLSVTLLSFWTFDNPGTSIYLHYLQSSYLKNRIRFSGTWTDSRHLLYYWRKRSFTIRRGMAVGVDLADGFRCKNNLSLSRDIASAGLSLPLTKDMLKVKPCCCWSVSESFLDKSFIWFELNRPLRQACTADWLSVLRLTLLPFQRSPHNLIAITMAHSSIQFVSTGLALVIAEGHR